MSTTDDQISALLAQYATLFPLLDNSASAQILFLGGAADDPDSFDKDGGKAGALGYYRVVNVSGQTVYMPCLKRMMEIALGGANAETLAALVAATQAKLADVDQAVGQAIVSVNAARDDAAAKALYATQEGDFAKGQGEALGDAAAAALAAAGYKQDASAAALSAAADRQAADAAAALALQQYNLTKALRVDDGQLSPGLYDDVLALRSLRKILRFTAGAGLTIGDLAGNYSLSIGADGKATMTLASLVLPGAAVSDASLSTSLYDDILALRTFRKLFRFTPGAGLAIGDAAGNYSIAVGPDGKATMTLASLVLPGAAVSDASLSTALYDDILALRTLRKMFRFVPDGGLIFGDPAGNYTFKIGADGKATLALSTITLPSRSVTKASLAGDVLAGLGGGASGLVYEKTVSSKQQVALVSGAGEAIISDGSANDRFPAIIGQSVRFASDRDGATFRAMRCLPNGSSVLSERGLVAALNRPKVYILIGFGQSLSIGTTNDTPSALSAVAYVSSVLMFNSGVRIIPGKVIAPTDVVAPADIARLVPAAASVYASGVYGQTHLESLAYRSMQSNSAGSVIFTAGVGGQPYASLKKGTVPWSNMLAAVQSATTILNNLGIDAEAHMFWQQGEADAGQTQTARLAQLAQLVTDANADIAAITGQSAIHVFAAQSPSLSGSQVPAADWLTGRLNPLYHCVGPMYDLPEGSSTQHLTSLGSYYQGELYWRAFKAVILDSGTWSPLIIDPTAITINGAVITAPVLGAVGNLQIDTTNVSAIANYGIEYTDNSSPPAISSVSVSGTAITITLASAPTATAGNRVLRAAWTRPGGGGGPVNGARTNICDQDALTSNYDGKALPKRLCVSTITF